MKINFNYTPLNQPNNKEQIAELFGDLFIVFFSVWTLVHQFAFFLNLSFRISWIADFFFALTATFLFWRKYKEDYFFKKIELKEIWIWCLLAGILPVILSRPDADDQTYLGFSLLSLDYSNVIMVQLDAMKWPYALTIYDSIRAAFSWITKVKLLDSYYIIFPSFVAIVVVIFQYRIFKLFVVNIPLAMLVFFLIMLTWGDVHRTPANFGFVRFFQGKSLVFWLSIPCMLFYWHKWVTTVNKKYFLLLGFAVISSVGFSTSGSILSFLMILILFTVTLFHVSFFKYPVALLSFGFFILYPLIIGLLLKLFFNFENTAGIASAIGGARLPKPNDYFVNLEMIYFVLGNGFYFYFALLALFLLPILLMFSKKSNFNSLFAGYFLICIFLILFPFTSIWIAKYSSFSMSWRWLFIVPFVFAIVLLIDKVSVIVKKYRLFKFSVLLLLAICFYMDLDSFVISKKNRTHFSLNKLENPTKVRIVVPPYYDHREAQILDRNIISPSTGNKF